MVSAAGENGLLLVAEAKRHKRSFFQVEGEIGFLTRAIFLEQTTINTCDFQRSLLQVVSFLSVQRQDLPGEFDVGSNERRNRLCAKPTHRFEPVTAVRRPETAVGRRDADDRIQKRSCFLYYSRKLLMMRVRKVALK